MRALLLIAGAALALAAPAVAKPDRGEHRRDHDRYESPYSNEAMRRERDRKEFARESAKAEREERRKERAYRAYDEDNNDDADRDDEDGPDDD